MSVRLTNTYCEKDYDPEWVKDIAYEIFVMKKRKITEEDKKLMKILFHEYLTEGLKPKEAIKKAKNIILSFKN